MSVVFRFGFVLETSSISEFSRNGLLLRVLVQVNMASHPFMEWRKATSHSVLRNGMHANPKSLEKTHPLQKWKLQVSPKPQLPSVSSFHPMLTGSAKKNLILGYTTVFFDVLGYSLITPILPFLSKEMNATDFEQGLLLCVIAST